MNQVKLHGLCPRHSNEKSRLGLCCADSTLFFRRHCYTVLSSLADVGLRS